jgi:hypothetical protein
VFTYNSNEILYLVQILEKKLGKGVDISQLEQALKELGEKVDNLDLLNLYVSGTAASEAELPATAEQSEMWNVGSAVPYEIYIYDNGAWRNLGPFQGPPGPEGPEGKKGETGATGPAGVSVLASGYVHFYITDDGYLECRYIDNEPPKYYITDDGYLAIDV